MWKEREVDTLPNAATSQATDLDVPPNRRGVLTLF